MSEQNKEKLPQNMQNLLMEIGEKSVLFKLFILVKDTKWEVYYNLGEVGCDLVLIESESNRKVKIEVKTRQKIYSTAQNKNTSQFTVTELEYKSSNYIVCYWFEENAFFIVPSQELLYTTSNSKPVYKFTVRKRADGSFDEKSKKYLNNWSIIKEILN